jgi:hypothetical protein
MRDRECRNALNDHTFAHRDRKSARPAVVEAPQLLCHLTHVRQGCREPCPRHLNEGKQRQPTQCHRGQCLRRACSLVHLDQESVQSRNLRISFHARTSTAPFDVASKKSMAPLSWMVATAVILASSSAPVLGKKVGFWSPRPLPLCTIVAWPQIPSFSINFRISRLQAGMEICVTAWGLHEYAHARPPSTTTPHLATACLVRVALFERNIAWQPGEYSATQDHPITLHSSPHHACTSFTSPCTPCTSILPTPKLHEPQRTAPLTVRLDRRSRTCALCGCR